MGRQLVVWACAGALALVSSAASAETVVAPGDLEFVEGTSNNCFPYICGPQRYQQVYEASHFDGISGIIEQIRYRVDGFYSESFSNTYDLEIRLSHTSVTATTLSTIFEDNIGGDETLVLDESAVVISGMGGSTPNPFNIIVDVDNLFAYNGVDNLLVDITVFSGEGGPQFDSTNRGAAVDKMQRVWGCVSCTTGGISGDEGLVTTFEIITNLPPDCSGAASAPDEIWPPDHKFADVSVVGVTDPDGDPLTITITGIAQDEPLEGLGDGNTCPDALGVDTDIASVRAERSGSKKVPGDGRVYHISFTAEDGQGGECSETVTVCVPHDRRPGHVCVDQGPLFDSTSCP